jgi:hypothetical protein
MQHTLFTFFEKYPTGISFSRHHIPGTANGRGIIKNLKTLYRPKLVNCILEAIEENLLTSSSAAKEVNARIDLLQAAQFIADSWRRVSTKTTQNCFAHCKHPDLEMPNKADSESDIVLEIHHVGNYEEFLYIDSSLQSCNENEDCEEAIVEQITANHQKTSEDQESDEDDTTKHERVTNQEARKFIARLQFYFFMQAGSEGSPISALETCADFVQLHSLKRTWQGTLD